MWKQPWAGGGLVSLVATAFSSLLPYPVLFQESFEVEDLFCALQAPADQLGMSHLHMQIKSHHQVT